MRIRIRLYAACACLFFAAACSHLPLPGVPLPLARPASLAVGEWAGTTSQGQPIAFTVSEDERVTAITVGYDFNGCAGSKIFADISVPAAPQVTCIPGPCSGVVSSYRAFGHTNGAVGSGPVTQVNGLFLPGNEARGQVTFADYPSCGVTPPAEWTARRR
ncbi:MAG TPA: hypothetical protein VFJ95_07035 [Gammaproteobacteria bacterium]|nr:hypothetical protein [Gammaproteobacteria bacterium]